MKHLLEVCLLAFTLTTNSNPGAAAQAPAQQPMQKGISVELAVTSGAVPVPDADNVDSLIVTITATGALYSGIDPIAPSALADEFKRSLADRENTPLYLKADARAPYTSIVTVLDAARTAGVQALILLTARPSASPPGTPQGLKLSLGPSR